jgi:hypothetical protein
LFEFFINGEEMVCGDQAHLPGEREIKVEDTTMWPVASAIVNITMRTNVPPGMCAV